MISWSLSPSQSRKLKLLEIFLIGLVNPIILWPNKGKPLPDQIHRPQGQPPGLILENPWLLVIDNLNSELRGLSPAPWVPLAPSLPLFMRDRLESNTLTLRSNLQLNYRGSLFVHLNSFLQFLKKVIVNKMVKILRVLKRGIKRNSKSRAWTLKLQIVKSKGPRLKKFTSLRWTKFSVQRYLTRP